MKAYKVFNPDLTCRNFKYKVGKTYTHKGDIEMCGSGFHSCLNAVDCFNFYDFNPNNKVCEVELLGEIINGNDKSVCSKIKIIKELCWDDVLKLVNSGNSNSGYRNSGYRNSGNKNTGDRNSGNRNTGDSNSGDWNSGNRNTGDRNSGYRNSGDSNSGDWNSGNSNSGYKNSGYKNSGNRNSGDWNSCNRETGFFNSKNPKSINVFNKPCNIDIWESSEKPDFIYDININIWVCWGDMTDGEKKNNKDAYVTNGYLKTKTYKEALKESFEKATKEDIKLLKKLPNFNSVVFEEITGIRIK